MNKVTILLVACGLFVVIILSPSFVFGQTTAQKRNKIVKDHFQNRKKVQTQTAQRRSNQRSTNKRSTNRSTNNRHVGNKSNSLRGINYTTNGIHFGVRSGNISFDYYKDYPRRNYSTYHSLNWPYHNDYNYRRYSSFGPVYQRQYYTYPQVNYSPLYVQPLTSYYTSPLVTPPKPNVNIIIAPKPKETQIEELESALHLFNNKEGSRKQVVNKPNLTEADRTNIKNNLQIADDNFQKQEWSTAQKYYGKALKIDPSNPDLFLKQFFAYLAYGKYEKAQALLKNFSDSGNSFRSDSYSLTEHYGDMNIAKNSHLDRLAGATLDSPDDPFKLTFVGLFLFY
ncbi:MAG: tetratricopeptide repeat protein, partial [Pirellulaceae bacterium]|nr:tetratricopeptide repeat protein [Pirellulaceae bacterium]